MQRLTIIRTPGDPDALLDAKREHMDPVMKSKAGEYGHILHVAARGAGELVVINVWESADGSERAARDPDIQRAREALRDAGAATSPPEFSHYEVVEYRPSGAG